MKLRDFLYDKLYLLIASLVCFIVLWIFLTTLHIQFEVIVVVSCILFVIPCLVLVVEYLKRAAYYRSIDIMMQDIDQKFLISEMMPQPTFIDAVLMQDIIAQATKSMADAISHHENNVNGYVDYIELLIHEIKTPLAGLSLIVENRPSDEKELILREVKEIQTYLDQILYYARVSSLEDDTVIQDVSLKSLVNDVVREMSTLFIEKNLKLHVSIQEEHVYVDPKWLHFMIKQVLDNSIKYTHPNTGEIQIYVETHGNSVSLNVVDNGIGIEDHDIGRVFNRGFTGARGDFHKQATGMGLYLVKTMADKLGIRVSIDSGDTTRVTLVIPKSSMYFRDSYENVRKM